MDLLYVVGTVGCHSFDLSKRISSRILKANPPHHISFAGDAFRFDLQSLSLSPVVVCFPPPTTISPPPTPPPPPLTPAQQHYNALFLHIAQFVHNRASR